MKILISGSSGLVGTRLQPTLEAAGHEVAALVRDRSQLGAGDLFWDPREGQIDKTALDPFDAVVNLAGEGIASGRWTEKKKQRIRASRVDGTKTLAAALAELPPRPRTLINASAVGYYGDRGDERLDESSRPGKLFLSDVCQAWEQATEPAAAAGVRVVFARFGVILSGQGGALAKMLFPFKLGLGGKIGSGQQYMSWIALDDVVAAIMHCLHHDDLRGPVNVVAPNPVTNTEYTKALGRVLGRPTIFPVPAFAARLALGEMADELLLASERVEPARLAATGFAFQFPQLEGALRHVLDKR